MISPNVIIIWAGTNASIPAGFTRETSLDATYPKGTAAATNPNTTGGSSTHTHTSPTHSHTISAHTHTYTLNDPGVSGIGSGCAGDASALDGSHTHTGTSGAASSSNTSSDSVTYAAYSSEPPYYTVIFIKPSSYQFVPNGAIMLWDSSSSAPTGFSYCDGTSTTPDLRNKYLKGAAAGADAGTTGGSTTNNHTIAHGHTGASHTHASATSSNQSGAGGAAGNASGSLNLTTKDHTHSVSLTAGTQNVTDYGGAIGNQSETVEPAYTKLSALKNTSGSSKLPVFGMVGLWLGTLASIPPGWQLCDGTSSSTDMRSRHLKCTNTLGELANTGGSNTHTHAAQSHSHTGSGTHTHGATISGHNCDKRQDGSGCQPRPCSMTHTSYTVDAATANYGSANTTADSSNNEPSYRTVAFIKFKYFVGGAPLAALL